MKKFYFVLVALLACSFLQASAMDVPPLKALRKPVEKKEENKDEGPVIPAPVGAGSRIADPARLCPEGAVWYVTVPDASRFLKNWEQSPPGKMMAEPSMVQTLRNNRFGLDFLFSDLPASAISPERVKTMAGAVALAVAVAPVSEKLAMAGYLDGEGKLSFVFVLDVGLVRETAFNLMGMWETGFMLEHPTMTAVRDSHAGDYIDVWTQFREDGGDAHAQIAAGFVQNMLIVSNNETLAKQALSLMSGGASVASSHWGERLAASLPSSTSADAIGYVRMDALMEGLKSVPIARQAVANWGDYIGHGGKDGEALYYGLQFTEDGVRETFLLPTPAQGSAESLLEVFSRRLRPVQKWTCVSVMPYQPNPTLFLAAQMEGKILGGLLRQERRIFGLSTDIDHFTVPPEARRLFTNDVLAMLSGEVGISFYPEQPVGETDKMRQPWLMVLPCSANPIKKLPRAESQVEYNGGTVMSRDPANWRTTTAWTVISTESFRRLNGHYLLIASDGNLLLSAIDQVVSGSSFAANKDFAAAVAGAEANHGLLFYINVPEVVVRQYPNLSQIMRRLYPRSSGFNSRPPLSVLRRYARGITGAIAPSNNGAAFTRVTVQAPIPTLGAIAADTVLTFPMSLRLQGRESMETSRKNLQALWLRLQLYSSRYGHFPDTLEDLMGEMRTNTPQDELRALFTAPAALGLYSPADAMTKSYNYMSGITPEDEPDIPVIMESQPWSEDFSGMYPQSAARGPAETGDFQAYRQYIRLDGKIVVMPEKRFQSKIVTRIMERE